MVKSKKVSPRWLPVISSLAFLFLLFTVGTVVSPLVGMALVGGILAILGGFASIYPDHHRQVLDLWTDKIVTEVHWILIVTFVAFACGSIVMLLNNFHLKVSVEKNPK